MTVKEMIEQLQQFPEELEVVDACYEDIQCIYKGVWTHSNYPYNKPDKDVIVIV